MIHGMALIASIALPLFNIPLILRIVERKSSEDVSLQRVIGVWVCIVLMAPAGLRSPDFIWRTYTVINFLFFSAVMVTVLKYRIRKKA